MSTNIYQKKGKGGEVMGEKLKFVGVGKKDVYNITAPFEVNGQSYIAGRVESRHLVEDAQTMFFVKQNDTWIHDTSTPSFNLEDPFLTYVGKNIILGGVEVDWTPTGKHEWFGKRFNGPFTRFYRGETLNALTHFTSGPGFMKDIRLVELANGSIGIFIRPKGGHAGRGQIGFTTLSSLDELTPKILSEVEPWRDQFVENEHGGVNEAHVLSDGRIGVLGHIASRDDADYVHYRAMAFVLDPETRERSPIRIIATRADFSSGPAKRPELADVIFPGGLIRHSDRTATLYAGLSDAEAGKLDIPDPFP